MKGARSAESGCMYVSERVRVLVLFCARKFSHLLNGRDSRRAKKPSSPQSGIYIPGGLLGWDIRSPNSTISLPSLMYNICNLDRMFYIES